MCVSNISFRRTINDHTLNGGVHASNEGDVGLRNKEQFSAAKENYNDGDEDNGVEDNGHEDGDNEGECGEVEGEDGEVEGEYIATEDVDEDDTDFVDKDYSLDEDENENIRIGDDVYDPLVAAAEIGHHE